MAGFFKAVRYTGTGGGGRQVTCGFQPDYVWIRSKSVGGAGGRGFLPSRATGYFQLGDQNGLWVADSGVNSIVGNATGFVAASELNGLGGEYIAFCFRAVSKITDIITWVGNGANRTVPHSLGVAPDMAYMQWYPPTGGTTFQVLNSMPYSKALGTVQIQDFGIAGNNKFSTANNAGFFNSTGPTSTLFSLGSGAFNTNPWNYYAFLFANKAGLCKIGLYTGDGNNNLASPIDLGFAPKAIILNRADAVANGALPFNYAAVMTDPGGAVSPWTSYFLMPDAAAWNTDANGIIISGNTMAPPLSANATGVIYSYMAFSEADTAPASGLVSSNIIRTF